MSNEFSLPTNEPGLSAFGLLKNSVGKFWNGTTFETYSSAAFANYVRTATPVGSSGIYNVDMPAAITDAGRYEVFFYDKGDDGVAGEGDRFIGSCAIQWNGAAVDSGTNELENSLISLEEAKNYLKVTTLGDDEILRNLLNEISSWISNYLGRDLISDTHVEYYSGDGSDELILMNYPIVSITSLYVDSLRTFAASSLVAASNLIVKKEAGIIKAWNLFGSFPYGESNIKVTYVGGYTTDYVGGTMPFAIRLAVKRMLDKQYRLGYSQRKLDNQSESLSGMNITFKEEDIPKDVLSMIDPYRRLVTSEQFSYAD